MDAVDYASAHFSNDEQRVALGVLLEQGRSAWRVGPGGQLVERIVPAVEQAAEQQFGRGRAGQLLLEAWLAAYGTSRNPSHAYRLAVRAVEAASIPTVLPKDPSATLGKVIAALRGAPAKWRLTFAVDAKVVPFEVLVSMLQMLWTNQYDRHVTENSPLQVGQAEAEAAVVLALTLVQWFADGHVGPA